MMRASGSPFHPPSKSQQAPCFGPEMITRKEPLAPHRNSRPFRVSGGPSRASARAAMDERNAGRNSSRIEALPIGFDQFWCAADAHQRAMVGHSHLMRTSKSNSRTGAKGISTPRGNPTSSWVIGTSTLLSQYSTTSDPVPVLHPRRELFRAIRNRSRRIMAWISGALSVPGKVSVERLGSMS